MSSALGHLLSSLETFTTKAQNILKAVTRTEAEKKDLEDRVSGLMQEVATLKEANAVLEYSAREVDALKQQNTLLQEIAKRLEESVAPLRQQVKDLEEFKTKVSAFIQNPSGLSLQQSAPAPVVFPEITAIDEELTRKPNNPLLYFKKANVLMEHNDSNGAKVCFELAEKHGMKTNAHFRHRQAQNLLASGQHREALETIEKAINAEPALGLSYYFKAEIYIAMGDTAKAKESAEIAKKHGTNIDKLNLN